MIGFRFSSLRHRIQATTVFGLIVWASLGRSGSLTFAQAPILTKSYDNARTGANTNEKILTPKTVSHPAFQKLASLVVLDGDGSGDIEADHAVRVEAQPLYVPGLLMSDNLKHDVVFVCTMSNRVWAFDANTFAPIWKKPVSLGEPFLPMPNDAVDSAHINKSFGILSTPVIDIDAGLMYLVNWVTDDAAHQNRSLRVNAIRLSDGQPPANKPAQQLEASFINRDGQKIALNQVQKQRAAMLLVPLRRSPRGGATHKLLYIATTGTDDPNAPKHSPEATLHGWVLAFDVDAWKVSASWVSTPSSFGGGIWQASQGPAADDQGNVYLATANGGFTTSPAAHDFNGDTDFSEAIVKLSYSAGSDGATLSLTDWFIPFRDATRKSYDGDSSKGIDGYDYTDQDLGSSGPILPPATDLALIAGKDGVLYPLRRNNLGKVVGDFSKLASPASFFTFDPDPSVAAYASATPTGDLDFPPGHGVKTHHQHTSPVYWNSNKNGPMLFTWGENEKLRAFSLRTSDGKAKLLAAGAEVASAKLADLSDRSMGGMPGGLLTLSANGAKSGIIWATAPIDGDANKFPVAGVVRAYDAASFEAAGPGKLPRMRKLWEARGFTFSKFCAPVVADGKVFVATYDGRVDVYGPKRR